MPLHLTVRHNLINPGIHILLNSGISMIFQVPPYNWSQCGQVAQGKRSYFFNISIKVRDQAEFMTGLITTILNKQWRQNQGLTIQSQASENQSNSREIWIKILGYLNTVYIDVLL